MDKKKKIIIAAVTGGIVLIAIILLLAFLLPKGAGEAPAAEITASDSADGSGTATGESAPPDTDGSQSAADAGTTAPTTSGDVTDGTGDEAETSAGTTGAAAPGTSAPAQSDSVQTSQQAQTVSGASVNVTFASSNSWSEGGKTCTQVTGTVTNPGSTAVSAWSCELSVGSGAELVQGWSGVYSVSGSTLTISNEAYNGAVPAGGSTEFGFIIKSSSALSLGTTTGSATGSSGGGQGGSGNSSGGNSGSSGNSGGSSGGAPSVYTPSNADAVQGDDWLFVKGNKIVDKNGTEVWLTGVNWFGYNTGTNTFDGLWACNLEDSLQAIADHGFNLLRIPMSVELVNNWQDGVYPAANFNNAQNAGLVAMNSLEIFDHVIDVCQSVGIKVMIDMHCAKTDSMGHMYNVWYNGSVTTEDFYRSLEFLADRYKNNDTVIAYDLKNEPHGKPTENPRAIWNASTDADNWKYVAEQAAMRVLKKNPNVLIMVEGIEIYPTNIKTNNFTSTKDSDYNYDWWGGNLRGVADNPINLGKYQNKLVYSPHDYGPAVYQQPWFKGNYTYKTLMNDCWYDNWFYIYDKGTAPLLIGEWGGYMTEPNLTWMTYMRQLIKTYRLHHTFWCFNANSGDTGGLVKDDFITWDSEKYNFVKEVLWQQGGKFVGLDHKIPLGTNGIALSGYKS